MNNELPNTSSSVQQKSLPIMKHFSYKHLPDHLQTVSKPFCELAEFVELMDTSDMGEKVAALRKILEAKDCAVRARLATND